MDVKVSSDDFSRRMTSESGGMTYLPTGLMENFTVHHEDCPQPSTEAQSPIMFYTVFSSIFLLGIVGNTTLILIFIRHKAMRTAPNTYILSLGVADLLTAVSCASAPLLASEEYSHPIVCKFFQSILKTAMGVSSYTLIALSAERYFAISRPLLRKTYSRTFTLKIVLLIWFGAIAFTIARLSFYTPSKCIKCVQMFDPRSYTNSFTIIDFFVLYLIPLGVVANFYILMAQELYFSVRSVSKESAASKQISHNLNVRKRIALTVLILVFMFALCYLPFNYLSLKLYFNREYALKKQWSTYTNLLFCVGCLHNSFNPVILYSLSKPFRDHFNNYLYNLIFCSSNPMKVEHIGCDSSEFGAKSRNTIKGITSVV